MVRSTIRGAVAAAGLMATTGMATAQEATPTPQLQVEFSGWRSNCQGANRTAPLNCTMVQQAARNGQLFASLEVRVPGETRTPVMLIRIPLGFALEPGLTYSIDTNPAVQLPIQACETNGCYAGAPLSDTLLDAMRRGTTFFLSFEETGGTRGTIEIPLAGFTAAYDGIR